MSKKLRLRGGANAESMTDEQLIELSRKVYSVPQKKDVLEEDIANIIKYREKILELTKNRGLENPKPKQYYWLNYASDFIPVIKTADKEKISAALANEKRIESGILNTLKESNEVEFKKTEWMPTKTDSNAYQPREVFNDTTKIDELYHIFKTAYDEHRYERLLPLLKHFYYYIDSIKIGADPEYHKNRLLSDLLELDIDGLETLKKSTIEFILSYNENTPATTVDFKNPIDHPDNKYDIYIELEGHNLIREIFLDGGRIENQGNISNNIFRLYSNLNEDEKSQLGDNFNGYIFNIINPVLDLVRRLKISKSILEFKEILGHLHHLRLAQLRMLHILEFTLLRVIFELVNPSEYENHKFAKLHVTFGLLIKDVYISSTLEYYLYSSSTNWILEKNFPSESDIYTNKLFKIYIDENESVNTDEMKQRVTILKYLIYYNENMIYYPTICNSIFTYLIDLFVRVDRVSLEDFISSLKTTTTIPIENDDSESSYGVDIKVADNIFAQGWHDALMIAMKVKGNILIRDIETYINYITYAISESNDGEYDLYFAQVCGLYYNLQSSLSDINDDINDEFIIKLMSSLKALIDEQPKKIDKELGEVDEPTEDPEPDDLIYLKKYIQTHLRIPKENPLYPLIENLYNATTLDELKAAVAAID